jgi:N-acetylglutamate synthase-like GNAT family acetyltransferase
MSSNIRKASMNDIPLLKELIVQLGSPEVNDQIIENRLQMIEGNPLDSIFGPLQT